MRYLTLAIVALLSTISVAHAQATEPPLARGDSVRFSLTSELGTTTWTGIVHDVKNPRDCFFIVHSSIEGPEMFSFGVQFPSDFVVERYGPGGRVDTVTAAALKASGIGCVEGHHHPDARYISREVDDLDRTSDDDEGA